MNWQGRYDLREVGAGACFPLPAAPSAPAALPSIPFLAAPSPRAVKRPLPSHDEGFVEGGPSKRGSGTALAAAGGDPLPFSALGGAPSWAQPPEGGWAVAAGGGGGGGGSGEGMGEEGAAPVGAGEESGGGDMGVEATAAAVEAEVGKARPPALLAGAQFAPPLWASSAAEERADLGRPFSHNTFWGV